MYSGAQTQDDAKDELGKTTRVCGLMTSHFAPLPFFCSNKYTPPQVVLDLMEPFEHTYRTVFIDRYYTSVQVAKELLERSVLALVCL
jgi:hypothetical protein